MPPPVLPAGSRLLCEFRAGRIVKEGTTAKPDTRRGLVRVLRVMYIALKLFTLPVGPSAVNARVTKQHKYTVLLELA
jgi:hypothetical protein